jgi:protein O-mannosyl-transferase
VASRALQTQLPAAAVYNFSHQGESRLASAATRLQRQQVRPDPLRLFSSPEKRSVVLCLLLVAVSLVVYNPIIRNGFINFDDPQYIVHNTHVTSGPTWETIRWSFSSFYQANWHPLTWISHALDYRLFRANPAGHHYVNVLLHAANAALLFLLFQSATGFTWRSLVVAALFALHPVNVESVAWAAERKNVLSMLFFLLAFEAYGRYARKPAVGRYFAVFFLFILGLMSKPQVITFPFLLLLWDYWPLGRYQPEPMMVGAVRPAAARSLGWLFLEKCPLFVLSGISAVITMKAQRAGHAIHNSAIYTPRLRLANAILSYPRYLRNAFWPTRLSPMYPHPLDLIRGWQVGLSALLLITVTVVVLTCRRQRYLAVGWFWFLGTLVPMLGLVQVGEQAMADRYAYQSFIGLFLIVSWGAAELTAAGKLSRAPLAPVAVSVVLVLSVLTYRQVGYWHDAITLWSHALQVTPERPYFLHLELGNALDQENRFDEAIPELRAAVDPNHPQEHQLIHLGFGIYDQRHGHVQEAIAEYESALRLSTDPETRADTYSDMGSAYRQIRDYEGAHRSFAAALQIDPTQSMALIGMGLLAQQRGDFSEAIGYYSLVMSREPTDVGYILLARAEHDAGHPAEAQAAAAKAAQLTTDLDQARQTAAALLAP